MISSWILSLKLHSMSPTLVMVNMSNIRSSKGWKYQNGCCPFGFPLWEFTSKKVAVSLFLGTVVILWGTTHKHACWSLIFKLQRHFWVIFDLSRQIMGKKKEPRCCPDKYPQNLDLSVQTWIGQNHLGSWPIFGGPACNIMDLILMEILYGVGSSSPCIMAQFWCLWVDSSCYLNWDISKWHVWDSSCLCHSRLPGTKWTQSLYQWGKINWFSITQTLYTF